MLGYIPQVLPASYIESKSALGGRLHGSRGLGNPLLAMIGPMVNGMFQTGTQSTQGFIAAQQQLDAEGLASQRSRRWAAFGAVAVGIAGVAGVVYLMRK